MIENLIHIQLSVFQLYLKYFNGYYFIRQAILHGEVVTRSYSGNSEYSPVWMNVIGKFWRAMTSRTNATSFEFDNNSMMFLVCVVNRAYNEIFPFEKCIGRENMFTCCDMQSLAQVIHLAF